MKINISQAIAAGADPELLMVRKVVVTPVAEGPTQIFWVDRSSEITVYKTGTNMIVQGPGFRCAGLAVQYDCRLAVRVVECNRRYKLTVATETIDGNDPIDYSELADANAFYQKRAAFIRRHKKMMESIRHPKRVSPIAIATKAKRKRERAEEIAKVAFAHWCYRSDLEDVRDYVPVWALDEFLPW